MNSDGTTSRPCGDACGTMPSCAPLSVPYVPFQQQGSQKYSQADALANGTLFLMARINGTVWKINLAMLNNQDTYRFTKKLGALKGLRWEILSGEEQERLKSSVLRAVSLLTSGQVMPGSLLSVAVSPLSDLQVVKETPWKWVCTHSVSNGRQKKVSIPKAYPGFAPVPGLEPPMEPAPARWVLIGVSAALALLLGLAGFSTVESDKRAPEDVVAHTSLWDSPVVGFMNKCSVTEDANPLFHRLSLGFGNGEDKGPEGFMSGNVFATHLTGPILVKNPDFTDFLIRRIFERKGWELPEQLPVLPYEREAYEVTLRELMGRAGG